MLLGNNSTQVPTSVYSFEKALNVLVNMLGCDTQLWFLTPSVSVDPDGCSDSSYN